MATGGTSDHEPIGSASRPLAAKQIRVRAAHTAATIDLGSEPRAAATGLAGPDNPPSLRIVVVSHVSFVREALAASFEGDRMVSMVGLYADLAEAVAQSTVLRADALLMDAALPDGAAALRRIRLTVPDLPIIVYGVSERTEDVIAWAEAGATGYLPNSARLDQFARLIVDIHRGDQHAPAPVVGGLIRRIAATAIFGYGRSAVPTPLFFTRRERQVAELVIVGFTDKEIAGRLGIKLSTVKSHVHTLLRKLGVRRRNEVADCLAKPLEPAD
jgi:two-component system nitrate/nitrite response regulator NarL